MTFRDVVHDPTAAYVLGRRAMRQERLIDLGWTLSFWADDERSARAVIQCAHEQYARYYPDDPVRDEEIQDALGLH